MIAVKGSYICKAREKISSMFNITIKLLLVIIIFGFPSRQDVF